MAYQYEFHFTFLHFNNLKVVNMKKIFLFSFLCVFPFAQWQVHASIKKVNPNSIVLKGDLYTDDSGAKSEPVVATLYKLYVEVVFNQSLGNLTVTVVNQQEVEVYQQTVKATAGSNLVIDTSTWGNGAYTLLISDTDGGCLTGVFELNR